MEREAKCRTGGADRNRGLETEVRGLQKGPLEVDRVLVGATNFIVIGDCVAARGIEAVTVPAGHTLGATTPAEGK